MLFNIDEKQLMLELKNKDERALKICMNKYYRYVVYIVENIIGSALPYGNGSYRPPALPCSPAPAVPQKEH